MTQSHVHFFDKGSDPKSPTLLLLHGTGGTERDLLGLGKLLSPKSNMLGVRGNVLEGTMTRYFRRIAEGVFDVVDLQQRTELLHYFLNAAAKQYGFDRNNIVAVGYSNGANIAGSLLQHHAGSLRGAVLHHPMVPRRDLPFPALHGTPVFIGAGTNDPICSMQETRELQKVLTDAGAQVWVNWESNGHQLTKTEANSAAAWFMQQRFM